MRTPDDVGRQMADVLMGWRPVDPDSGGEGLRGRGGGAGGGGALVLHEGGGRQMAKRRAERRWYAELGQAGRSGWTCPRSMNDGEGGS